MNMNTTALECNFTSFDTTEAQFMKSIEIITAGLTNDSLLPSVNVSTETGILVDSRDVRSGYNFFQLKDFVQMKLLTQNLVTTIGL